MFRLYVMKSDSVLPQWAPRVSKELISKLYHSVGRGMMDEKLIDEVGYALLSRCESIIGATEASRGSAACPTCKAALKHSTSANDRMTCTSCGWTCLWRDYFKTYQKKQLHAGGIEEFCRDYVIEFVAAKSAGERLVLIDTLIHRYHWENTAWPTRPSGANLIAGKTHEIIIFLDQLSYGDHVPPDVDARRQAWREKRHRSETNHPNAPAKNVEPQ